MPPLQTPPQWGGGHTLPAPTRRLRRLVALPKLNVWIRHCEPRGGYCWRREVA